MEPSEVFAARFFSKDSSWTRVRQPLCHVVLKPSHNALPSTVGRLPRAAHSEMGGHARPSAQMVEYAHVQLPAP